MAKVKKYSGDGEKTTSVWNNKGDKRYGFASKDRNADNTTRYGVGIDNVGNPYRGAMDREINTPLGTIDYGYDGDTVYGGVTPNVYSGRYSNPVSNESGRYFGVGNTQVGTTVSPYGDRGVYVDRNGQPVASGGILGFDEGTLGVGGSVAFPAKTNAYNEVNTPLGLLAYGQNANTGQAYGSFTPQNQYYLQALANLLMGR